MNNVLRGVFLTSAQPEQVAAFFKDAAEIAMEPVDEGDYRYWKCDEVGVQIAIHSAEAFAAYAHPPVAGSNLTHLYFKIADQAAFLAHIKDLGIDPSAVDEVVVTLVDPDGRNVLFGTA